MNCNVRFTEFKCSGVRYCQYLHPLLQGDHDFVSIEWEEQIDSVRRELYANRYIHSKDANTEQFALLVQARFKKPEHSCHPLSTHAYLGVCQGSPRVRIGKSNVCTSFQQCIHIVSTLTY